VTSPDPHGRAKPFVLLAGSGRLAAPDTRTEQRIMRLESGLPTLDVGGYFSLWHDPVEGNGGKQAGL